MPQFSRRAFLVGGGASVVAVFGGSSNVVALGPQSLPAEPTLDAELPADAPRAALASYGPAPGEPFPVPAAPLSRIHPAYLRTRVAYTSGERPGTIVIDPRARYLYFVERTGTAIRYGVGVGRQGFAWFGTATVGDKQEWPDWYPPNEMIARQPELLEHMSDLPGGIGMLGGPGNPLGARA